jgi:hypothetical protein
VMVSYTRARAESLIPECKAGFWERPERIVLLILGALANKMAPALWLLAIGPNITVIHRILYTRKEAKAGHFVEVVPVSAPEAEAAKPQETTALENTARSAPQSAESLVHRVASERGR